MHSYFLHVQHTVPKSRAKLFKTENYQDPNISGLIEASVELWRIVQEQARVVQDYYLEYVPVTKRKRLVGCLQDKTRKEK